MSKKEQIRIINHLSILLDAGIPIIDCITILKNQSGSNKKINIVFDGVINALYQGKNLSHCFKISKLFDSFSISIIKIGEKTGYLKQNLKYLAQELTKQVNLKHKILSALTYPIIILLSTLCLTGFLLIVVFPKLTSIFLLSKIPLPLTTRILIGISVFLKYNSFALAISSVVILLTLSILFRKKIIARKLMQNIFMRLPLIGTLLKAYIISVCFRTLALLLKSSVTLEKSLKITAAVTTIISYKEFFLMCSEKISDGTLLSSLVNDNPRLFAHELYHFIAVGERAGNLSEVFIHISEIYERTVEETTKNLSLALEPVLMISIGLIVGFVALSVISPLYEITQNIK